MGTAAGPILGIAADFHDASAALVIDGVVVAAVQEDRFSRKKHDPDLPYEAMKWCLEAGGVGPSDLVAVAFHGKPLTTYERVLRSHARSGPRGFGNLSKAIRTWTQQKLWIGYRIERALHRLGFESPEMTFVEHHVAHGASAFYPSPFDSAAVVSIDGVGEWTTTSIGHGRGVDLDLLAEMAYPNSLGLLYSALTAYCGFSANDGESKLMGLAPYGQPTYADAIRQELIELNVDGTFRLNARRFDFEAGRRMLRSQVRDCLDGPPAALGADPTQREADIAASIQVILDEAVLNVVEEAHRRTGESALCLAGGVALNCVTNGRIRDRGPFDDVWVQPAAGDAGGSLGAALWVAHSLLGSPRPERDIDGMAGCALGPAFEADEVASWLTENSVAFDRIPDQSILTARVASLLDAGAIVGWFQGRQEFGPRALGNRSIVADPRHSEAVREINARVKGREGFRPLAPAVLEEHAGALFTEAKPNPYMLMTSQVLGFVPPSEEDASRPDLDLAAALGQVSSPIPACTHVDGSARVQAVSRSSSPLFHALLSAFFDLTGCPALINTSFNLAGEPVVRSPADALRTAASGGLDILVIEDCLVEAPAIAAIAGRLGSAPPLAVATKR